QRHRTADHVGNVSTLQPFGHQFEHIKLLAHGRRPVSSITEFHACPSFNTSSSALASRKSAVSNPSVNQEYTGASSARAASCFPCCCHRRARLMAARSSRDLACC